MEKFQEKSQGIVLIALILVLIGGAFYTGKLSAENKYLKEGTGNVQGAQAPEADLGPVEVDPISDSDFVRGNKDGRFVLYDYSDLECPYCKDFHATAISAVEKYGNELAWVYRHFPLLQIHPKAQKEAEAAECAAKLGGQDAFWAYIDKVYEITPSNDRLDLTLLPTIAGDLGLNVAEFNSCLESGDMAKNVNDDLKSGISAGVEGTPGVILEDRETGKNVVLPGAVPLQYIDQVIESFKNQ